MTTRSTTLDQSAVISGALPLGRALDEVLSQGLSVHPLQVDGRCLALSDLDLRLAIQDRVPLDTSVRELARDDLVAASHAEAESLLQTKGVPAVLVAEPLARVERSIEPIRDAVVMAGGFGTRLRPLTDEVPKPLLDVGGRPLLHRILEQLSAAGIERVGLSVHYLADRIRESVGDGSSFGLEVRYLEEDRPLDTGAGLVLFGERRGPFLVINGDVLTDLDLVALGREHVASGRHATVATWLYANPLAYGVVETDGVDLTGITEKPVYRYPINCGIYAFSPEVLERVEPGQPLAMVDFLNELAREPGRVGRFPIVEYWNDVGSHADYERAQREVGGLG